MRARFHSGRSGILAAFLLTLGGAAWADGVGIDFEGRTAFAAYTLLDVLPEEPEKLNDDEVEYWAGDAAYGVERFYLERGYFHVAVTADVTRPDPRKKNWSVVLKITEGPRYRFGVVRVRLDGESAAPPEKLHAREGNEYEEEAVVRDRRDLARFYGNAGFVRAEVADSVILRDSAARADVVYHVARGQAVVFDTLVVSIRRTGDDSLRGLTSEKLLRSLVPYRRGDTVRVDENDAVIEKLQSTAQYNSVRLEDAPRDAMHDVGAGRSVVTLDVEEKVPGRFHASAFYETQYGFGVSADAAHSNVAGSLNEVRVGAGFAQNKQNASLGYGSPITRGMLLRFDDDLTVEWFQDKLPDEPFFGGDLRVANTASLSRNVFSWLRALAGAELEYKSRLVADSAGALARESGGLLNFTATGFLSFLDQALNPARGTRFALTLGNGGTIYEGGAVRVFEDRHYWADVRSAYYYYLDPLPQFKTAVRLDGGRFFGAGGQNADRFFLGGPRNVRSYGFRQVCPDIPPPPEGSCPLTETPLEPAYVLASAELRLSPFDFRWVPPRGAAALLKPVEVVPFADYGKVWNLRGGENFSFSREFLESGFGHAIAYGGGIRYPLLGVFNFRLDLAWGRPGPGRFFGQSSDRLPDQWLIDLAQAF